MFINLMHISSTRSGRSQPLLAIMGWFIVANLYHIRPFRFDSYTLDVHKIQVIWMKFKKRSMLKI